MNASMDDDVPTCRPADGRVDEILRVQRTAERRCIATIAVLVAFMLASAAAELSCGASGIGIGEIMAALFGQGQPTDVAAVRSIRLPRVVCALVAGSGLALAGAVLQSVLENPLASASTVGISQGASFGASLAIIVVVPALAGSASDIGMGAIALFAFAGAMASSIIVLLFSRLGGMRPESIVLVGVALSALWGGSSTIMQYFASDVELTKAVFWQFGDLGRATWSQIGFMAAVCACCGAYFFMNRWNYNALQNGAHAASGLGVDLARTRVASVAVASLAAAAVVSFVGLISFIGLIAPHIARRVVGSDYRYLLPASLVLGAVIMLGSDLAARMVISPVILPIGAITSFLGAPFFLVLLYRGYAR